MANKVAALALLVVVVAAAMAPSTEAVTCSPMALASCAPAIMSNVAPTSDCCANLQAQRPCLCSYKKNPSLQPYVGSAGAQRVAQYCKVTVQC